MKDVFLRRVVIEAREHENYNDTITAYMYY